MGKEDALDRKLFGWLAEAKRYFQHLGCLGIILYLLNEVITPFPMLNTKFLVAPLLLTGTKVRIWLFSCRELPEQVLSWYSFEPKHQPTQLIVKLLWSKLIVL